MHSIKTERNHLSASSMWKMGWALLTRLWHGRQSPLLERRGSPLHQHISSPGSHSVHFKEVPRHYKALKFPFIFDASIVCFSPLDKAELFFHFGRH